MCRPASFVVRRNSVLQKPWCDSHEVLKREAGILDRGEPVDWVAVEVVPPDDDYRLPLDQWICRVDQDILPEWYNAEEAEIAVRATLPEWYATHVITEGKHEIDASAMGDVSIIVLGGELTISGQTGGYCRAYDSATINSTFIHIRAADPVIHRRVVRAILNPKQRDLMLIEGKLFQGDSLALSRN